VVKLGEPLEHDLNNARAGIPGADDLGSMTAIGTWLCLGIFPMIPGEPGFTITSPLVNKAIIRRGKNGTFTIITKNADIQNAYVQSVTIDGKPHGPHRGIASCQTYMRSFADWYAAISAAITLRAARVLASPRQRR